MMGPSLRCQDCNRKLDWLALIDVAFEHAEFGTLLKARCCGRFYVLRCVGRHATCVNGLRD
jgi:hypothetical protein